MAKSPDAFRTISEVAEWLGIQAHVLRFWESKFTQVKPVKRAGGRRYYRPNDMLLLGGIKKLLYEDGFTIKGVQKILREEGMGHVASLSPPLDELTMSEIAPEAPAPPTPPAPEAVNEEKGVVLKFDTPSEHSAPETTADDAVAPDPVDMPAATPDAAPASPVEAQADDAAEEDAAEAPAETTETPQEEPTAPLTTEAEPAETPTFVHKPRFTPSPTEEPAQPPSPKPRVIEVPAFKSEAEFEAAPSVLSVLTKGQASNPAFARDAAPLLTQLEQLKDRMAAQDRADQDNTSAS